MKKSILMMLSACFMCFAAISFVSCSDKSKINPEQNQNVVDPNPKPEPQPNPEPEPEKSRRISKIECGFYQESLLFTSSYSFTYDDKGRVTAISGAGLDWTVEYSQDKIVVTSPINATDPLKAVVFNLKDGRVNQSVVYDYNTELNVVYNWSYDKDGHLQSILCDKEFESAGMFTRNPMKLTFDGGNLTAVDLWEKQFECGFEYGQVSVPVEDFNPYCLHFAIRLCYDKEDYFLASLLNVAGKQTSKLPIAMKLKVDGVMKSYPISSSMEGDVLNLDCPTAPSENALYNKVSVFYEKI